MSEKVKQNFKPIKPLARDANGGLSYEPFTANGRTYHFIRPGDPLGIRKWTEYEKLKIVVGTGQTFSGIVEAFKQITDLAGADKKFSEIRTELIAALKRNDIHSVFHYVPLHSAPIGVRLGRTHGELAVTDSIADRLLRLPLWLGLEEQQAGVIQEVISALTNIAV